MSTLRDTAERIVRSGRLPVLPSEKLFATEIVAARLEMRRTSPDPEMPGRRN